MGFFEYLGVWIDSLFDFIKNSSNTDVVQILSTLVGLTITLQIMFKSYQSFAGKSNEPVKELIWDITIRVLVVGVALNLNGYLDTIKTGMENLHNIMSGNTNLYAELDEKFNATTNLISKIWHEYSFLKSGHSIFATGLSIILVFLGFLFGIVPSFLIVVTTGITLKILLLIAPIVIFATLYPWFKNVFTQWLNIFITNLLTVYIVGILLSKFTEKYGDFIQKADNNFQTSDVLIIGFNALIMGTLLAGLLKVAISLADKIGTVSIETLSQKSLTNKDNFTNGKDALNTMQSTISAPKAGADFILNKMKGLNSKF
ncbi:type IV secretion system protein [Arcobacter defluvii]|uniref:P-type type IV conjugative transfer system protein TrbL/VirB6 n=1 Tax=Arcobacter defluvii TaxID=873191 RepID=A0AAE7E782_9BACT|nr:type IV secretion system protein [Arcobacter defluvii]QKF77299.1 P-type type IV conjugative transfer system protein TrbL/VirB6 [Arcobacter defluvii]QKF77857.1 P-type type IV conjugative transfer system protein TrbL/VirB6 [Arcobacter defluvii]RXI29649.1 hypothetical protein CP964_13460 [Arcobacter defluvii]